MAMMASTTMMTQFEMSIFFSFWTMLMLMTSAAMVNDGKEFFSSAVVRSM